jgi:hypothetical protein
MVMHATPEQSFTWLRERMGELEIASLENLAQRSGSDKGNISRIFHQQQRPRVDALEPMAFSLEVSVYELLMRRRYTSITAGPCSRNCLNTSFTC